MSPLIFFFSFFFFNDTATTEIYTLSLHDALPISSSNGLIVFDRSPSHEVTRNMMASGYTSRAFGAPTSKKRDRKSTRLNSSHGYISYAVFCLKKKKKKSTQITTTTTTR